MERRIAAVAKSSEAKKSFPAFPRPTGWLLFKIQIDWRRNKSLKRLILS